MSRSRYLPLISVSFFFFFFTETKLIGDSHHGFALLLRTASSCKFVSGFSIGLVSCTIKIVLCFAEIYRVDFFEDYAQ